MKTNEAGCRKCFIPRAFSLCNIIYLSGTEISYYPCLFNFLLLLLMLLHLFGVAVAQEVKKV